MYKRIIFSALFVCFVYSLNAQQQPEQSIHFRSGDWVSYRSAKYVTSVAKGNQYIYFGTTNGIIRYDFFRNKWADPFTVSDGLPFGTVKAVAYDRSTGFLWCISGIYLCFYLPAALEWRLIDIRKHGVSAIDIIGVGEQQMWAKDSNNVFKIESHGSFIERSGREEADKDNVRWSPVRGNSNKKVWTQFFMDGGYRFLINGYIQDEYFREFQLTTWFNDKFGNMWIGTWGLGAGRADLRSDDMMILPAGPISNNINFMAWVDNGMWMGGVDTGSKLQGITFWNMDDNQWKYFEPNYISGLENTSVRAISAGERFVWFGTDNGLVRYDMNRDRWKTYHINNNLWDEMITSLVHGDSCIYVGTDVGINKVLLPSMDIVKIHNKAVLHRRIYCMENTKNNLWAGTDRGIIRFDKTTGRWEYVSGYPGMPVINVSAISTYDNEVWFGTDYGVEMYDLSKKVWKGFLPQHYPTGGRINTILADSGNVWFGTDNGVIKYIKNEDRWMRFTTKDGLVSNLVNWILLDNDYIWFGTDRGLTKFFWNAPYRID